MILNLSANALGLGNAATPFGIRAMQELDRLNPVKGTATDSMVLFLAINTSSVTLLPTGVIALRAAAGSSDPASILPTTLFATLCSTLTAVLAAKAYGRFFKQGKHEQEVEEGKSESAVPKEKLEQAVAHAGSYPLWVSLAVFSLLLCLIPMMVFYGRTVSPWIIPGLMMFFLGFGAVRRVRVYEVFVEGATEGFKVAVKIIPYLVAILRGRYVSCEWGYGCCSALAGPVDWKSGYAC